MINQPNRRVHDARQLDPKNIAVNRKGGSIVPMNSLRIETTVKNPVAPKPRRYNLEILHSTPSAG
jgi:hypothetical protein